MEFLHRFDSLNGDAVIVATDAEKLRAATFLDGRENFANGERLVQFDPASLRSGNPARFIFHVGFCGSTLLARLVDQPGSVLALREPQSLTDFASQRRAIRAGQGIADCADIIGHALAYLGQGEDTIVIKPSNWVNGALPDLVASGAVARAVFLTCNRREFLIAAFRGGRERLAFCARLASELADEVAHGETILAHQVALNQEPLDRMARICVLLHAMQEALFAQALASAAIPGAAMLTLAELTADPGGTMARAQAALDLPAMGSAPNAAALAAHAKDPQRRFSPADSAQQNDEVELHHAARFERALEWMAAIDLGAVIGFSGAASR
jgi:hypothetical protein